MLCFILVFIQAIVEYLEPSEAKAAFTKLAYSKFKNMPLYLEWAPKDSLSAPSKTVQITTKVVEEVEEDEEPEEGTTIFVKNLNFETTDEALREVYIFFDRFIAVDYSGSF